MTRTVLVPLNVAARRLRPEVPSARALRERIKAHEREIGREVIIRRAHKGPGAFLVDMDLLRREMPELFVASDAAVADAGRAEAVRLLAGVTAHFETMGADMLDAVTVALGRLTDEFRGRLAKEGP